MSLLKTERLDKKFGPHYALSGVGLSIEPGEVHALIGENGAGKSTFIKVITGVYPPDGGEIAWRGEPVRIRDPKSARELGIAVVHQDRNLIPSFTGYENLYLGLDYPARAFGAGVDWKRMRERASAAAEKLGIALDLDRLASRMSPPERTMLEILRAAMQDCRLLILDEPTASLTDQETERLFSLIERLKANGTAVLYVSHRLDEILRISDRVTVFRNGKLVRTERTADADKDRLVTWMSDAALFRDPRRRSGSASAEPALEVRRLSTADGRVTEASLTVRRGEIVGLFGLAGSGRTELLEAVYGLSAAASGDILLEGRAVRIRSPREALDHGVALIPEERKRDAIVMNMSIRENMTLPVLDRYDRGYGTDVRGERRDANAWMDAMKVKATGAEQPVAELSGGNQQKVVFAKALMSGPKVFLCDEPTQAVDVVTREEIHKLLRRQAESGCGVLFVSSDLQEVLDVADRLYVLREGRVVAELDNDGVAPEQVLGICFGHSERGERVGGE